MILKRAVALTKKIVDAQLFFCLATRKMLHTCMGAFDDRIQSRKKRSVFVDLCYTFSLE